MNKMYVIGALVLLVLAIFVLQPELLGRGGGSPLSVVPADTMTIPTDVACVSVQDCVDYALAQDPDAVDVRAVCDGTCAFIVDKTPLEVVS